MCDYSLFGFPNRLARDGEELVAHRFSSGCIGFIGIADASERANHRTLLGTNWPQLKAWFFPRKHDGPAAVCIPPGTEIRLVSLDPTLRMRLGLAETGDAIFIQVSAEDFAYRDGLRFRNGRSILLQQLPEGQRALVRRSTTGQTRSTDRIRSGEASYV